MLNQLLLLYALLVLIRLHYSMVEPSYPTRMSLTLLHHYRWKCRLLTHHYYLSSRSTLQTTSMYHSTSATTSISLHSSALSIHGIQSPRHTRTSIHNHQAHHTTAQDQRMYQGMIS